jgi:hypothetical protein
MGMGPRAGKQGRAPTRRDPLVRQAAIIRAMTRVPASSLSALGLVLVLTACGPSTETVKVSGTPASPATDGSVTVAPRPQFGNAELKIDLKFVTPAERLSPTARIFVVWARHGNVAENLGTLEYDGSTRGARFEGTVVSGPFDLLVTAETSARAAEPSTFVLLAKTLRGSGE